MLRRTRIDDRHYLLFRRQREWPRRFFANSRFDQRDRAHNFDTINGYVYVPGTFNVARLRGVGRTAILFGSRRDGSSVLCYWRAPLPSPSRPVTLLSTLRRDGLFINPRLAVSKTVRLNTTASGAQIAGNVYGFPVLVRLTSSNFDFTQAQSNGGDLRFTNQDNSPIAYEIERWDAAAGAAEVWVKMDTDLWGRQRPSHHHVLGKSGRARASSSASVFDTANGFQGVWHLDGAAGAIEKEATARNLWLRPWEKRYHRHYRDYRDGKKVRRGVKLFRHERHCRERFELS